MSNYLKNSRIQIQAENTIHGKSEAFYHKAHIQNSMKVKGHETIKRKRQRRIKSAR